MCLQFHSLGGVLDPDDCGTEGGRFYKGSLCRSSFVMIKIKQEKKVHWVKEQYVSVRKEVPSAPGAAPKGKAAAESPSSGEVPPGKRIAGSRRGGSRGRLEMAPLARSQPDLCGAGPGSSGITRGQGTMRPGVLAPGRLDLLEGC